MSQHVLRTSHQRGCGGDREGRRGETVNCDANHLCVSVIAENRGRLVSRVSDDILVIVTVWGAVRRDDI